MTEILTPEQAVWDALQVDLISDGNSPETLAPFDQAYIRSLIEAAEERIARFTGKTLAEFEDGVPVALQSAVILDVMSAYRNRLNPSLPDAYFEFIGPLRKWGFG